MVSLKSSFKQDNSTWREKVALRQQVREEMRASGEEPHLLETHGGVGKLWAACWSDLCEGIVLEIDRAKSSLLARQRPTWVVYEGDAAAILSSGAASWAAINVLDVDPWGSPWKVVEAFFNSSFQHVPRLYLVATDGIRLNLKLRGMAPHLVLQEEGREAYDNYLACCRRFLEEIAGIARYDMVSFAGLYCGHAKQMTIYKASFERVGGNS